MKKERAAKDNKKDNGYSPTEVGALLEEIRDGVRRVAEGHGDLDRRLGDLEVQIHGNTDKLTMVEIVATVAKDRVIHLDNRVSLLDKKVTQLDDKVSKLDGKVSQLDTKVSHLDEKVSQLDTKVDQMREELKGEIREIGTRLSAVEASR